MDSLYLSPTTELEAINTMLSVIGEAPVNTLEGDLPADAQMAVQILGEVCREVQSRGWYFNTEQRYPLTPNESGEIELPANAVHVDPDPSINIGISAVPRGNKLYNLDDHSFVFKGTIYANIVFLLSFNQLPQAARHYIVIRASRKLHDRVLGSDTLHGFSEKDEQSALVALLHEDSRQADRSVFGKNLLSGWDVLKTIRGNR